MSELIKEHETIYICFENPKNHTFLVHDGNNNFSIMSKEKMEDNKESYVFKQDNITNSHIEFLLASGFNFEELIVFLPIMIEMNAKFDEEIITKKED